MEDKQVDLIDLTDEVNTSLMQANQQPAEAGGVDDEVKITVKFPASCRDLVAFLDEQVAEKRAKGLKSDRSDQIRVAIRHRLISKLPTAQRHEVLKRLAVAKPAAVKK